MPKSRRQGRGRRWRGPLSQHRPRHVRRLQVGNLVAQHLHRARGRERRRFQPGPPLALLDFPRNSGAQNSSGCRNGLACQTFASGRACARSPALICHVLPRCRLLQSSSILIPGDTVWRRCKAGRLAILNDAAAYFAALREALLLATRQVYIIGWDIHSLTRFVGPSGQADDGYPEELGAFLKALLKAKPELRINILSWNFPALYAAEREWNSAAKFTSDASDRLCFCFDSSLPLGSAQHQKIVVIDGALAFVGGLDLTIRRWDTSAHDAHHPLRVDPDGKPYPPFHDVQCMVDGEAAASLTELAESRWRAAGCTVETSAAVTGERWPASVPVQSRGHDGGHRPDRDRNRERSRRERGRAAVRGLHQRGRPLHLYREPVHQRHRHRAPAGAADAGRAAASCSDRHAEDAFVLVRIAGHAERPRRIHRRNSWRQASWTGFAFSIPSTRDAEPGRRRHGAQQGDDRRRPHPARRFGQPQQSLDGRGHRVRSRLRGDVRGASAIYRPASPPTDRAFLRRR